MRFWSSFVLKTFFMTVCSCHVTYAFQSECTLYNCLNVKELLARSRREIWSLSDCSWNWTHNHLVHKRTLNRFVDSVWNAYVTWQEQTVKCTVQISTHKTAQSFRPIWLNGWLFVYELSGCGFEFSCILCAIGTCMIFSLNILVLCKFSMSYSNPTDSETGSVRIQNPSSNTTMCCETKSVFWMAFSLLKCSKLLKAQRRSYVCSSFSYIARLVLLEIILLERYCALLFSCYY